MQCRNANACADALLRVFVQSTTASRAPLTSNAPRPRTRALSFLHPQRPVLQPHNVPLHRRTIYRGQTGTELVKPKTDRAPWDEEIDSPYVNFVTSDGKFYTKQPLKALLDQINRQEWRVVQLEPGNTSLEDSDPKRWPTTKMISIKELRIHQAEKEKRKRQQQKGSKSKDGKVVEISWQIEPNDLQHRISKLKDFLSQGRKVEVLILNRKRSKKDLDNEDREDVLAKIREELGTVKGAREKKVEGNMGKVMQLYWEVSGS